MKYPYFSARATFLFLIVMANILMLGVGVLRVYRVSIGYGDPGILNVIITLLVLAIVLNVSAWAVVVLRVFRPLESLVGTLYRTARIKPQDVQEAEQHLDIVGKLTYLLDVFQDSTRRLEQAAKDLKVQKEYLQSILETIPDAIITIDDEGKIQMVNAGVEKSFGYTAAEILGRRAGTILPSVEGEDYDAYLKRLFVAGRGPVFQRLLEQAVVRKDGLSFPAEIWVSELKYDHHRILLAVIRDVSLRKRAEAERERYLHDLETSNRELDDFAYIVSHDLKEPLRGLQSTARFLREDYEENLDEEGKARLRTISDLSIRMEALLEALLHYSRLGKTALAIQETDLDSVVRDIVTSLSSQLKEKNATVEISRTLPTIVCDHVRIREVFQNLIYNAMKYNDKSENKIEIGFVSDHPHHPGEPVFFVRDHGIGIAPRHLESIFRIFKRLHPKGAYGGGTGSGLAICKKIIAQHGGEIWAESRGLGAGATFFFTVPQKKEIVEPEDAARRTSRETGKVKEASP